MSGMFKAALLFGVFVDLPSGPDLDRDDRRSFDLHVKLDVNDFQPTTITVSDSVGATVDPDKPLGGVRNDNPNLQYGLPAIADGSFQINGESINVATSDTLNNVVDRINNSNAGVTAVFNAVTERIEFVQDTLGSVPTIDIQNDTSNFIEATKLDSAVVNPGIDPETLKHAVYPQSLGFGAQLASIGIGVLLPR